MQLNFKRAVRSLAGGEFQRENTGEELIRIKLWK